MFLNQTDALIQRVRDLTTLPTIRSMSRRINRCGRSIDDQTDMKVVFYLHDSTDANAGFYILDSTDPKTGFCLLDSTVTLTGSLVMRLDRLNYGFYNAVTRTIIQRVISVTTRSVNEWVSFKHRFIGFLSDFLFHDLNDLSSGLSTDDSIG